MDDLFFYLQFSITTVHADLQVMNELFAWFGLVRFMVFNTTFNNILAIWYRSVLLVEETGVPIENHRPVESHYQTLSQNVVLITPTMSGFEFTTLVVVIAQVVVNPTTIRSRP